jgi:PAS domain S-box-containing protein
MHHAVSGEIVLEQLIKRLMVTVVEHAGAVRGLVLLVQGGDLQIAAEAVTGHNSVIVHLRHQQMTIGELPRSVLNYVVRTQAYLIVDDATVAPVHSVDEYVLRVKPRSILCLPLVKQARLVGVLYLENTFSPRVFTADRVSVLQLLASQAAISIENAMLFRDIQKAQEQGRIMVEELRRSFDMIPSLAWRATPDGTVEYVNRQWLDYSGASIEDVRAGKWAEAFHPDDKDKVWAQWRQCLASGKAGEVEARMRRFDGEYRSFLVRALPMLDDQGRVLMWHGTNTDIESIRRAEQAQETLARASRLTAMGELTVSIAHEMAQPLMAIESNATTCLRWLADERLELSQARLAADRIIGDVHRARDVIASIRALARKTTPQMVQLSLNAVINEILDLTSSELERHGVSLEVDLRDGPSVLGVRVQLQQVLLNLVMNAIEAIVTASVRVKRIRIASVVKSGQVTVSVADTGIGVDQGSREKIFDPFFTTKPEGLGMGLSICRSIVEAHGGRLWVEPNASGGSVFSFSIPVAEESHGSEPLVRIDSGDQHDD